MDSKLINIKKSIPTGLSDSVYTVLSSIFNDDVTLPLIDTLLDQNCFMNFMECYYDDLGQIVGLNSFRTYKVKIQSKTIYVSRGFSNIKKEYRGNKTTAFFVAKALMKAKIKSLFSMKEHYFFFIASGVGNFYSSFKYINHELLYPSLDNTNNKYSDLVCAIVQYFNYEISNNNPIKVKDPFIPPGRLDLSFDNKDQKERQILEYFQKHSQSDQDSLISLVHANWKMVMLSIISYCKIMFLKS